MRTRATIHSAILGSSAARLQAAGASFALNMALARLLGAEGFGAYAFVISCVLIAATAGKWGWDKAAVRFVATHVARGDVASLAEFLSASRRAVLGLSIACGFACVVWLLLTPMPLSSTTMIVAALIVPAASFGLLLQGQLRGASRVLGAELPEGMLKPLAALVLTYIAVNCIDADPVGLALTSFLGAAMLANVVAGRVLVHAIPASSGRWRFDTARTNADGMSTAATSHSHPWRAEIHGYGWLGLAQVGLSRGPAMIAGLVLDPAGMGLVAVAMRLAEPVAFAVSSVGIVSAPRLAALYHQGDIAACRQLLATATKYSRSVGLLVCSAVALAGPWLLKLFGADFTAAYPVLVSVCIAQFVAASCGPAGYVVTMSGHQRDATRLQLYALAAGALATLAGGKWFGFVGAGIATAATLAIASLLLARLAARILNRAEAAGS